ncbi:hypothetical protein Acy02nite_09300 [Actinoplanes cyaneus]|jgi:hypothetical protein|uniref:Uncharacterized protein n=1 Tax=Actinoplanes cyaneus TaxID=52696 RepID=A0A919M568_9ACTN|nr:hypothetical protein [Actinoplanes cyaneus]MCW2137003.1 hypothetical protein [Actinoplanes cyaneus]GID63049.1 hypothetical protein Acy02nite_09300 [Actinoplanes cyaneus]
MKPAAQPEDDAYVLADGTRKLVDRKKVDRPVLLAILDRVDNNADLTTAYFTNFVS